MYTYNEKCLINLSDIYTLTYGYIAESIIKKFGLNGERAVREGVRRYGTDRAQTMRAEHLQVNAKINMKSLFNLYPDLPGDPRFRRELQELNPQERVSHTLRCPMAEVWDRCGLREIGRIYCEEFHNACYSQYAFGYAQVNLAKTLTQDGDTYCEFNVVLRPENLPDELKPICFAEYDPWYRQPNFPDKEVSGKDGFNLLSIKLYYHLLSALVEMLGAEAAEQVDEGLSRGAAEAICILEQSALEDNIAIDKKYIHDNLPINLDIRNDILWDSYRDNQAPERAEKYFVHVIEKHFILK